MDSKARALIKKALEKKVPQLDLEAMNELSARFWRAEREKAELRRQLARLREQRKRAWPSGSP